METHRARITDHPDARLIDGLRSAPVNASPFVFKLISPTLDPEVFAAARASFPTPERLRPKVETREDPRYSDRRLTIALGEYADLVEPAFRDVWRAVGDVFLRSTALIDALRDCFAPIYEPELRARHVSSGARFTLNSELVYDQTGFSLLPHTDGAAKVATMLTYFAEDGDPQSLGTVLFAPKDPDFTDPPGKTLWQFDNFGAGTQVPYLANLTIAFARHRQSFHGVLPTTDARPRRLIQTSVLVEAD